VLESLAMRYASALRALAQVLGRPIRGVHILGGGSQNAFLDQATADATGLEVWAGPTEATALGNIAVQAIADRRFADLAQARAYVAERLPPRRFAPRDVEAWRAALPRYLAVEGSP
jgi:rhamnulokinase